MTRSSITRLGLSAAIGLGLALPAAAQVTQTTGTGSAVSTVDASATFTDAASYTANTTYTENGLTFVRSGLGPNMNQCTYAGCPTHVGFAGFSGNYLYSTGYSGYFAILAETGKLFTGLEFRGGTGFYTSSLHYTWEARLAGALHDQGSGTAAAGGVLGFASATGFDELRFVAYADPSMTGYRAPAIDDVRAEYVGTTTTPEPATVVLLGTGLAAIAAVARRRRRSV